MKLILQKWLQKKNKLTDNQILEIRKSLYKKYSSTMRSASAIVSKNKDLNKVKFEANGNGFEYFPNQDIFVGDIVCFDSYAYHDGLEGKEAVKSYDKMKNDILNLMKELKSNSKFKDVNFRLMGDDGESLNEYITSMKKCASSGSVPSNMVYLSIIVKRSEFCKMIVPDNHKSDFYDDEMLCRKYDEFVKFLKYPKMLAGGFFWCGTLKDMCIIIEMSYTELYSIISKNIKLSGAEMIDPKYFEDPNYGKKVSKSVGKCIKIEQYDGDEVVWSVDKKKLFYIGYEHNEFGDFSTFPYSDMDLEDIANNHDVAGFMRQLLKAYDESKHYNIIK